MTPDQSKSSGRRPGNEGPSASSVILSTLGLIIFVVNILNLRHASPYWYLPVVPIATAWLVLGRRVARRVAADMASRRVRAPSYRRSILALALVFLFAVIMVATLNLLLPSPESTFTSITILATVVTIGIWQILAIHRRRHY